MCNLPQRGLCDLKSPLHNKISRIILNYFTCVLCREFSKLFSFHEIFMYDEHKWIETCFFRIAQKTNIRRCFHPKLHNTWSLRSLAQITTVKNYVWKFPGEADTLRSFKVRLNKSGERFESTKIFKFSSVLFPFLFSTSCSRDYFCFCTRGMMSKLCLCNINEMEGKAQKFCDKIFLSFLSSFLDYNKPQLRVA